ncbi:hypothetical protein PHMEG_00033748 [Phytophthora megakarya]|uniref:Uncharacterized protein n=1 Tax=Phytophthora megakarya TaxID=4795 RepID=A0A225USN3_9STRA|nr:hypothetical protein PHMEG_00033748 [Phytophthora megakarya]
MRLHPTFYVERLKPFHPAEIPDIRPPVRGRSRNPVSRAVDAADSLVRGLLAHAESDSAAATPTPPSPRVGRSRPSPHFEHPSRRWT